MPALREGQTMPKRFLLLVLMLTLVASPSLVTAQIQQGATITILRGEIAIIHPDGTAVQPAASGSTVSIGDEIRTIGRSGALITFFVGTEIELGADTILIVDQLSKDGDKINVSLRQVLGATVNRVQTLAGSGSSYQIQAGGAVALVRGTTFALVGPVTTSAGNVVSFACKEDCTSATTFAGCAAGPNSGFGVVTSGGKVASDCVSYGVSRSEGLFDAAFQGVTTTEQNVQGDTRSAPAGQVAAGSRQQIASRTDQQRDEKDRDPDRPIPTATPVGGGVQACNSQTRSGGPGTTTTIHQLGRSSGAFKFEYDAFDIPDRFQVRYEGNILLDTGLVSNRATHNLSFAGSDTTITVTVIGPTGTAWEYIVSCPT